MGGTLDVEVFVAAIEDADNETMKVAVRTEIKPYESKNVDIDDMSSRILGDYDERVVRAVQQAFDLFDLNNTNEILAVELERVLCSLGLTATMDEITGQDCELNLISCSYTYMCM
jgi:hypothetical protein